MQCRGKNETNLSLLQDISGPVPESRIGERLKTKCRLVENGGLFGIFDIKFDIVGAIYGQEIVLCGCFLI